MTDRQLALLKEIVPLYCTKSSNDLSLCNDNLCKIIIIMSVEVFVDNTDDIEYLI